jgi:hypothetical protein
LGLRQNRGGLVAMLGFDEFLRFAYRTWDTPVQVLRVQEARRGCIACCMPWLAEDKRGS